MSRVSSKHMSVSKVMPHVPRPSECVFYEFMLEQGCSGEHTIMMMNRLLLCLLLVMPTIGLTAAFHKKRILETAHPSLRFASLNLHLGADFNTLFYPSNADKTIHQAVSKFWDFIQVADHPSRAKAIAQHLLQRCPGVNPHVTQLQEFGGQGHAPSRFFAHAADRIGGANTVGAQVLTSNPTIPLEGRDGETDLIMLEIQDSDVALVCSKFAEDAATAAAVELMESRNALFVTPPELTLPLVSNLTVQLPP